MNPSGVTPFKNSSLSKKEQVETMFDQIARRYDFLNRFLSLGIDKGWRRKAIRALEKERPAQILDVATGTGDLAIEALKLNPEKITGIDLSEQMIRIGRKKIEKLGVSGRVELIKGDCENLPFPGNKFDAITVAFGVRNFENPLKGLTEMSRVLRPGGYIVILEFSNPKILIVRKLYNLYFSFLLPFIGRLVSSSRNAYTYLPESVKVFSDGKRFTHLMEQAGFTGVEFSPLTFGIATLYRGTK